MVSSAVLNFTFVFYSNVSQLTYSLIGTKKINFCPNLGKKSPREGFLDFLENFVISFSWKQFKMKTNIVNDITTPISYLAKFSVPSYGQKWCQPTKLHDSLKCNVSRKKWMMKFIFGMQINIEAFYKLILSFGCL